jgi:ADP-ribose pyrophosphatase YjhB (NUDIX family)
MTMNVTTTDVRIRVSVGAFIIRKSALGLYELLLFQHPDCTEAPLQIPGGGVDPGESLECALYREIWEESGLENVTLVRKLGIGEWCWTEPGKLISQRHCFLLEARDEQRDRWNHCVQGEGIDAGMNFDYFWHRPDHQFKLFGELGYFLNPTHIPELFPEFFCDRDHKPTPK